MVLYAGYRYGWDARAIGLLVAAVGVGSVVVQGTLVRPVVSRFGERSALLVGLLFSALFLAGLFIDRAQFFHAYLVGFVFWAGITLGSLALLMLQHLTGGAWGVVIRRVLEASTRTLPLILLLFIPVVVGLKQIYPWMNAAEMSSPALQLKAARYLNPSFFVTRAAIYFALCFTRTCRLADALFLGAAFGMALFTKATAYLFAPWPLAAIFLARADRSRRRLAAGALIAVAVGLALNLPQYVRNYGLSGSIMGFDSAQADGFFRWRNETFGWRQTVSNILRNLSEQLGARSATWNQGVYNFVIQAHERLGIDVNDPGTTWRWSSFAPPRNANHEANTPNRWHLAIILVISCALILRALRRRERERPLYALALLCAFVAFCAYLKWQPFLARLLLPLFVLGAPLAGVVGEIGGPPSGPIRRWGVQLVLGGDRHRAAGVRLLRSGDPQAVVLHACAAPVDHDHRDDGILSAAVRELAAPAQGAQEHPSHA